MEKFVKTRVIRYLIYGVSFKIMTHFIGFETTMILIGSYILVDMEYYNENKDKNGSVNQ